MFDFLSQPSFIFMVGLIMGIFLGAYISSKRFRRKLNNAIKALGHHEDDDLYYYDEDE